MTSTSSSEAAASSAVPVVTIPLALFSRLTMIEGFARSFIAAHQDNAGSAEIHAAQALGLVPEDDD